MSRDGVGIRVGVQVRVQVGGRVRDGVGTVDGVRVYTEVYRLGLETEKPLFYERGIVL